MNQGDLSVIENFLAPSWCDVNAVQEETTVISSILNSNAFGTIQGMDFPQLFAQSDSPQTSPNSGIDMNSSPSLYLHSGEENKHSDSSGDEVTLNLENLQSGFEQFYGAFPQQLNTSPFSALAASSPEIPSPDLSSEKSAKKRRRNGKK